MINQSAFKLKWHAPALSRMAQQWTDFLEVQEKALATLHNAGPRNVIWIAHWGDRASLGVDVHVSALAIVWFSRIGLAEKHLSEIELNDSWWGIPRPLRRPTDIAESRWRELFVFLVGQNAAGNEHKTTSGLPKMLIPAAPWRFLPALGLLCAAYLQSINSVQPARRATGVRSVAWWREGLSLVEGASLRTKIDGEMLDAGYAWSAFPGVAILAKWIDKDSEIKKLDVVVAAAQKEIEAILIESN